MSDLAHKPAREYIAPDRFLNVPFGDCDDASLFTACVLQILRVPYEFTFLLNGENLEHVYIKAYLNGKILIFDYTDNMK